MSITRGDVNKWLFGFAAYPSTFISIEIKTQELQCQPKILGQGNSGSNREGKWKAVEEGERGERGGKIIEEIEKIN